MSELKLEGKLSENSYGEADGILFCGSEPVAQWAYERVPRDEPVSVRYWLTDREVTLEEAQREAVEQILGKTDIDWGAHYSELTGYLWTDEEFKVGGHDMIERLRSALGKYLHLEVIISA